MTPWARQYYYKDYYDNCPGSLRLTLEALIGFEPCTKDKAVYPIDYFRKFVGKTIKATYSVNNTLSKY